ncbi:alpha-amylase [Actinacidiphila yanglinensis]|uniref:Alpha-amylase n=1 Tax=Actinacidiphila yanglinensis TaxID=310779 RepID=A0A1H5V3B3_9ACTN|nr:carbohydrate-binding module family 20 domain-containing protein [Actinacidiphila yanglinensis]SEF81228.1 alpha-amylase [Actinacidiphila yanglinensis]
MLRSPDRADPPHRATPPSAPQSAPRSRREGQPGHRRKALLAAAALLAGTVVPLAAAQATAHAAPAPVTAAASGGNGSDVTANLFMWNWSSVASECTDQLGPKGYGSVLVSPPQDSIRLSGAHPWWEIYQPVGYDLNSRMGTEAQFRSMVTTCHAAGVKVYADAVINHMSGTDQSSTDSYGGDGFDVGAKSYGQVPYDSSDFHTSPANCPNSDMAIDDWNSQTQVQECDLEGLADLYTETDDVRGKIAGYLGKLIGYGVDGFRIDSAKHINQSDMANIESRLPDTAWGARPYVLQEVALGGSGNLAPGAFESNGSVIGFDYANAMKSQFQGNIANLRTFGQSWGLEPSDKDGAMVTNHDTERNGSTLNYKDGSQYTLATEFMLAWGYGAPTVYSGFAFNGSDDSPPADGNGYVTGTDCASPAWVCTDRGQGVANMVGWHNAAQGQQVANWWDNGNNAIAFSRGNAAWIGINNSADAVTTTFTTGLAAGTYCDVIHGDPTSSGGCTGSTVTVGSNGTATVTLPAHDSVALYGTGTSAGPPSGTVAETFQVSATAPAGQSVYLVGSIPELANWDPAQGIPLASTDGTHWTGTPNLPASTSFAYKYVLKDGSGNVTWEPGDNHTASTGSGAGTLNDTW